MVVVALALSSAGCSSGALTDAERSRATTLPTPTRAGVPPQQVLTEAVGRLLTTPVSVDDDYVVDGIESEARVTWRARATVVEASVLPLGGSATPVEVFRRPGSLLTRPAGVDARRRWPAGPALARFARPRAQELSVLLSTRVTARRGSLYAGTVSALTALRLIGTDGQLRQRRLLPPPGVRVPATVALSPDAVLVTVAWDALVTAAGSSSRHGRTGTWTFRYRSLTGPGPQPPAPDQVVPLPRTDPGFDSALRACNARVQ
jgi:hypothetical protein